MITIFNIFIVVADQQLIFGQNIMNLFYLEFDLFRIYFTAFNEVEPLGTAKVEVVINYTDLCAFGFVVTPICKARGCI